MGNMIIASARSDSPPLVLGPALAAQDGSYISASPSMDTPPRKTWEHNFRSFLRKRNNTDTTTNSTSTSTSSDLPPIPVMTPLQHQTHQLRQPKEQHYEQRPDESSTNTGKQQSLKIDLKVDTAVRGGTFFSSVFGGISKDKTSTTKSRSTSALDSTLHKGQDKALSSPSSKHMKKLDNHLSAIPSSAQRRVQSQANMNPSSVAVVDELDNSRRNGSDNANTTTGAFIVPPPTQLPDHINLNILQHQSQQLFLQQQHAYNQDTSSDFSYLNPPQIRLSSSDDQVMGPVPQLPPQIPHYYQYQQQTQSQQIQQQQHLLLQHAHRSNPYHFKGIQPPNQNGAHYRSASSSSRDHSMSPSSATSTDIKRAFTEFHNSSLYAKDSTSAYLGDEPSSRGNRGNSFTAANQMMMYHGNGYPVPPPAAPLGTSISNLGPPSHSRHYSMVQGSGGNARFSTGSLPTVDENVSIHKSMRMLRPFQSHESWQAGRRYLIGPAALAACPLLQGISSLSLSSANNTRGSVAEADKEETNVEDKTTKAPAPSNDNHMNVNSPARLPPLFGCIVLGKALLSYVVAEYTPEHSHHQRWWSSSILILRQNYLLEYDQQTGDTLRGVPRGYAHLQYSRSYAHADFADALELEFYASPCARTDRRTLTIRLEEAREERDSWIACLNRAAQLRLQDLYDFENSLELGRGRYAGVYPARRKVLVTPKNSKKEEQYDISKVPEKRNKAEDDTLSSAVPTRSTKYYDCALKVVDKNEFWRRVVKGRERADTLVRETSVQATMTKKCANVPAFSRLRGFFETSDHVVLELELIRGMDLFQYVSSKGLLSEKESACILRDILTVLDGMNCVGLAHRDIKPANCLMCKNGAASGEDNCPCVVKVADFGMATFVGVDGLVRGRCGTPGYVAPEIFSAGIYGGYGNKVDVFSAGVTLYVMLCGYEPFYGETDADLVAANKTAKLDFPSSDWKKISCEAKNLVKRMMEPDPNRRLSAREALQDSWITKHAGKTESATLSGNSGVNALSDSLHNKGEDTCIIS